jgi:3-oxoacyl-[acyl-carrier protein] reductase
VRVDLDGGLAVVTGGARGIGRAIAETLSANGARIVIVDIDADEAAATAQAIRAATGECVALEGDVSSVDQMAALAADIGTVDILVNNAGINTQSDRVPIHEYSVDDWRRIMQVDLDGVFAVSRAFIPGMLERGGRIVNISSVAGVVPLRLQSAFVAAKAGVINLTKSMALELGPQGILVNAVAPGSTLTDGTRALFYGEDGAYTENAESLLSHIPLGRPGTVEEVAHAVLFLVAPGSSYITGAVLTVDGGWTAGYTRDW